LVNFAGGADVIQFTINARQKNLGAVFADAFWGDAELSRNFFEKIAKRQTKNKYIKK
jgi:hypothetical protein